MNKIFDTHQIDRVIHFATKAVGEWSASPSSTTTTTSKTPWCSSTSCATMAQVHHLLELLDRLRRPGQPACHRGRPQEARNQPLWLDRVDNERDSLWTFTPPTPSGTSCCSATSTPLAPIRPASSARTPTASPTTSCPISRRLPWASWKSVHVFGNDYPTPDGTGVRDYIHVLDLARGHVCALNWITQAACHLNLGTGTGYLVLDVIPAFSKACGKELPYVIRERRAGDIAADWCCLQGRAHDGLEKLVRHRGYVPR